VSFIKGGGAGLTCFIGLPVAVNLHDFGLVMNAIGEFPQTILYRRESIM